MGRKLNLSHLSEGECRQILDVIQRDFSIRQKEKERLVKLQKLVKDEEQKRLVLSRQKQFNEKYCICCFSSFGLIFNKRTECKSCGFFICRDCSVKPEGVKVLMCLGCAQQRELQVQVCEWFYGQIRNRFRRFGSAKVVRSLYKRDSLSSESFDHCSNDSGVGHQLSPPAKGLSPEEASRVFMETLEKQTGTAGKEVFGIPYKALLDNPDWLPLFRPQMSSVAVQAPEDVLSDVLDSRQALEDFVFNLPPEEEELEKSGDSGKKSVRRNSGPKVVIMDPEGEPLSKTQEANRKVHFGDTTTLAKPKESGSSSMTASGAAYHILSPIEEVLSSPELTADANGNKLDSSIACSLKDRGSIDRLALGEDDKRVRADSSSTISPHDWDSGIHMSLCLSQDGGWEVSQSTASGTDSVDGLLSRESKQNTQSEFMNSGAGRVYPSLDANDTLDSMETNFNSIQSERNLSEMNDEFISSSCILNERRQKHDENDETMNGIEIEQLTLSRSSSEETLKTDDDDDIDGKVGNLTMEEFLDQLTSLSLSATSESADEFMKDAQRVNNEADCSRPSTEETLLLSSSEEVKKDETESIGLLLEMNEETQPLLGGEEDEVNLPQGDSEISPTKQQPEKISKSDDSQIQEDTIKAKTEEKHFKCTKSHHHHSGRSHDPSARSKSPYRRSKSSDDFALSGRAGETRSYKSNGNKSHRRDGDPNFKCTKESHHHGKHHERSPSNRFIRYDSLPLVVEVFEADGNYHSHHHNHRDFRQFSRESDSNDSEPSNKVAGKTSRSGAKLVRAPHLSPKSSYEEDPTQSRQHSMESNTTEDTMPKSTSQSSGPTTPESRRDSQQLAGMSSENESLLDSSKEEQRSPDKPLHQSPTQQGGSRRHYEKPNLSPSGLDYPAKDNSIKDFIRSLHNVDLENYSKSRAEHSDSMNESPTRQMELNLTACPEGSYTPDRGSHKSLHEMPHQLKSPGQPSPYTSPTQPSPGLASLYASHKGSPTQFSPSTSPTQTDPRASPKTTPKRLMALRKDIQELANLSKKVSITQEEMLQSAEEVLTSAHKMSNIQNQVEELENVLDSLERTVIGDSSSLYGSSSDNDDEVVGPKEQVVEDMQILERQLAYSNTEDAPSESNSASAVRMITTTALKLLSTTEDAMKSHTASLSSPSTRYPSGSQDKDTYDERLRTAPDVRTTERDVQDSRGFSRQSSEEEEMCACSSTDGSRPNSLTLDDALTRNGKHETEQLEPRNPERFSKSKSASHLSEKSRNQTPHGVSFLHLHPSNGQDSPPIATLMCEIDEDVRNGNGVNAAVSPYQNGDGALLDDIRSYDSMSPTDQQLMDMTFNLDEGVGMDRLPRDKTVGRRRKERKLRKSTGYKTSPAREKEADLLLYNEMAQLEEKVYLSAGKVFTLEDRLKILQERVNRVDRLSPEENIVDLEDKIALTIAQVAQSESQVAAVEAQITALQRSREQSTMDKAGYQADGKFATVSVAMCNLTSPEKKLKLTSEADDGNDSNGEIKERHISTLHMSIGTTDNKLPFTTTDGEQTAEVSLAMNETEEQGVAGVA